MGRLKTTEEFIADARKVHGMDYDYSEAEYINRDVKVCIICPKHGRFWQPPWRHLYGNTQQKSILNRKGYGCPTCEQPLKIDTEEFIRRAKEKHGDRYDYSEAVYTRMEDKVTIICHIHGRFRQTAQNHLIGNWGKGHNCPGCSKMNKWRLKRKAYHPSWGHCGF